MIVLNSLLMACECFFGGSLVLALALLVDVKANLRDDLSVDTDGKGMAHGWTQVATLTDVTGLTDVQVLAHNGTLIVS